MSSSVPISLSNAAVTAALAGSSSSSGLVNRFSEIENPPKSDDFTATNTNNDRPRSFSHSVNYSDSYSKANNSFSFSTQPVTDDIISVSGWVENEKKLLALEFKYESEQLADKISHLSAKECEKLGLSLLALKIVAVKSSLFGGFSISLNRLTSPELDEEPARSAVTLEAIVVEKNENLRWKTFRFTTPNPPEIIGENMRQITVYWSSNVASLFFY